MKVTRYLLPAVCYLLSLFFTSCEVEFSPNAKWKNVPVVYCVLDQDDDTTWARVQRCYLSEDNIYSYGQNSDSINYPQGSIEVYLLGYENGYAFVEYYVPAIDARYFESDTAIFIQ